MSKQQIMSMHYLDQTTKQKNNIAEEEAWMGEEIIVLEIWRNKSVPQTHSPGNLLTVKTPVSSFIKQKVQDINLGLPS